MLASGTDANAKGGAYGQTLLIVAAEYGRADCVKLLLERGADPNATDNKGNSAIYYACRLTEGHLKCLALLTVFTTDANHDQSKTFDDDLDQLYSDLEKGVLPRKRKR